MSKYSNLSAYLRPGHPITGATDSTIGTTYLYRTTTTLIAANTPSVGETWADGRNVISANSFELAGAADISELLVVTSVNAVYAGIGTPAVEQSFYTLRWRPVQKPLEVHPEFLAAGTYAFDATARKCVIGWRAEQDPALRSLYQFKPLDSSGLPGATVDIPTVSPNAHAFLKLVVIGVEEYTDYLPIWRKRSIYRGSTTPPTSGIGMVETPAGSPPSGYQWVKSADDAERVGTTSRWRRDEEWEGCITVYASSIGVYPP